MGLIDRSTEASVARRTKVESDMVHRVVHTPSPWCVSHEVSRGGLLEIQIDHEQVGGPIIGVACSEELGLDAAKANARLIAAAPELLSSCLEMIAAMFEYQMDVDDDPTYRHRDMIARANAAIEKATT